jgi:uncharacterized protein (DUF2336 family)
VQALDTLEVLAGKGAAEPFLAEFVPGLEALPAEASKLALSASLARLRSHGLEEAQWYAKEALHTLADAATVALLEERYAKLADLYARRFLAGEEYPAWALADPEV